MPLGLSWSDYNEALIRRGEVLLDVGFVSDWSGELDGMNYDGKLGRPFEFPDSYIEFIAFLKIGFKLPYRMVQGAVRALSKVIRIEEMHFTHMRRRILAKTPLMKVKETDEPLTLVVDSSGLSTTRKGTYIEKMWRKQKRKFVKLHIAVDKKTKKIVEFRVTGSGTADTKKLPPMVKSASKKNRITKVYADTAYDSRRNFNLLDDLKIEPAIKVRRDSTTKAKGSPLRRREVILFKKLGYEGWKNLKDYGRRWLVEIVFSAFKRMLGEELFSRRFHAQKIETSLKILLYNKFMTI
jgi:hypothetical protein